MSDTDISKTRKKWKANFDFPVDYNDHFETPLVAYQDILPLLDRICVGSKGRKNHIIYDPYYCNGRVAEYLRQLGFEKVEHAKRDFYRDVADQTVPHHHTLITNPPYSDTHKEKCLNFCIEQFRAKKRPFFLLMPNYVAARRYYRQILGDNLKDVAYFVPKKPYDYDHPEGTGHSASPFVSLWFCCIGHSTIKSMQGSGDFMDFSSFVPSLDGLESQKAIPTGKRPNPRQRKKRKATLSALQEHHARFEYTQKSQLPVESSLSTKKTTQPQTKRSRHRDESGKRTKKRF